MIKYRFISVFASVLVASFLFACKAEKKDSSRPDEFLMKLNHMANLSHESDKKISPWIKTVKIQIDVKPENKVDDSMIDKISKSTTQLLKRGDKIEDVAYYVKYSAKFLSYLGLPGAALIADMADAGENSLGSITGFMRTWHPQKLSGTFVYATDYLSQLKTLALGLSDAKKQELALKLNFLAIESKQAEDLAIAIMEQNKLLLELLEEKHPAKSDEVSFFSQYAEAKFSKQMMDLTTISALAMEMKTIGQGIVQLLAPHKAQKNISSAIEKFQSILPIASKIDDMRIKAAKAGEKF